MRLTKLKSTSFTITDIDIEAGEYVQKIPDVVRASMCGVYESNFTT